MKPFIIGAVFVFATIFPIVFVPLLVITLLVSLLVTPHVLKHGMGWTKPGTRLHKGAAY